MGKIKRTMTLQEKIDKKLIINAVVFISAVAFVVFCHIRTYRIAYVEGYKQAIKDEIEYFQQQKDSIKCVTEKIDRALKVIENKELK